MSGLDPDLIRFYELIESVDLPVFIGGSVATSVWGEPRATLDIDLVIAAEAPDAERLLSAFPSERYYAPPVDVVRQTLGRASPSGFNIIDMTTSLKADCYARGRDELNLYGFATAEQIDLQEFGRVLVASPTYLISRKLRYFAMSGQDKHARDIRGVIMGSADRIDHAVVERWAKESGTLETWQDCLRRAGEE
jgi:hypothetical protein